jgi:hypothetical protein
MLIYYAEILMDFLSMYKYDFVKIFTYDCVHPCADAANGQTCMPNYESRLACASNEFPAGHFDI